MEKVISLVPTQVPQVTCGHEDSGSGHFLQRLQCSINVPGMGPVMEVGA